MESPVRQVTDNPLHIADVDDAGTRQIANRKFLGVVTRGGIFIGLSIAA